MISVYIRVCVYSHLVRPIDRTRSKKIKRFTVHMSKRAKTTVKSDDQRRLKEMVASSCLAFVKDENVCASVWNGSNANDLGRQRHGIEDDTKSG